MTADLPFGPSLKQPDQRSCGPSCLVVARMALDPSYAEQVVPTFDAEVLATHRRVTGGVDSRGAAQIPWPLALGTPPWAVAREMGAIAGVDYGWRFARWGRDAAFDRILAGLRRDLPVPVYVGSGLLPRHVVLALEGSGDSITTYDPARGSVREIDRQDFEAAKLGLSGWDVPWFTVTPRP